VRYVSAGAKENRRGEDSRYDTSYNNHVQHGRLYRLEKYTLRRIIFGITSFISYFGECELGAMLGNILAERTGLL
jgi:hypothetical protein